MTKLIGVLVGCGAIAREHLSAIETLEGAEIVAVCDLSPARAEAVAERFKVAKWYTSYEEMLDQVNPDLVHITTPPSTHFQIAKECLSRGLNVLCEKPIALVYEEFKQLKQLAVEKNCVLLENQNLRFHSSVLRIQDLLKASRFGDLVDVQVFFSLNLIGEGSPFVDRNAPHFGAGLPGGVIGDFLPHIAYLAHLFTGPVIDLRTIWIKRNKDTPLAADEFRGFIKGESAPAYVGFSGSAKINGYWIRITGTEMYAEANLLEPPRLTLRRYREGEPALSSLFDGIGEGRDVLSGAIAAFSRKLGGTSNYDGLPEMIARVYRALGRGEPQSISLDELEDTVRLVDCFTASELKL